MGELRDVESDGTPGALADGDSTGLSDDEDGVMFGNIIAGNPIAGLNVSLQNASAAQVDAWIDFNGDGAFQADERILDHQVITDAAPWQTFNFDVPSDL